MSEVPVLVIGAGPVGLTFAAEMARYGVRCRVVDKATGTKEISKALILHVRTQEVLDAMGLTHQAQDAAVPMKRVEIIGYGKHVGHGSMEGVNSPHPYPIILGQNVTEHLLQQHLERLGGHVEWETEATAVVASEAGVDVTLRKADGSEETVRAEYVIGADGTHSITRQQAGLSFEGAKYAGQAFIQADSKIRWSMPKGVSYLWFTAQGYMMVIEMPDGLVRTFVSVPDSDPTRKGTTLEEVNEALNRLGGVDAELYDPVWVALFRVNHRAAPQFRQGRVFIAGDAAHEHVPIGGQGMNTSIQDAFNLAWKLAHVIQGRAPQSLLDTYQTERHPIAEQLLSGTDEAYTNLLKAGELGKAAVRLLGPWLLSNQTVRETMRNTLEEINVGYRKGPLTEDYGGSRGPHAGDRMLDASVVRLPWRETAPVREVLRGTMWTILVFSGRDGGGDHRLRLHSLTGELRARYRGTAQSYLVRGGLPLPAEVPPDDRMLLDPMLHLHDQYGIDGPCIYAIRPDCYIGFRGTLDHEGELTDYLDRHVIAQIGFS